ncbi:hypothetical protein BaRGS_00007953, partial [Batillaria attramentaria]
ILLITCPLALTSRDESSRARRIDWSLRHAETFRDRVTALHECLKDQYGGETPISEECEMDMTSIDCKADVVQRLKQFGTYLDHISPQLTRYSHTRRTGEKLGRIRRALESFMNSVRSRCERQARRADRSLMACDPEGPQISAISRGSSDEWTEAALCLLWRIRDFLDHFRIGITEDE